MSKITYIGVDSKNQYTEVREVGEWRIALYPVLYGWRIRIWDPKDQISVLKDLCFGAPFSTLMLGYKTLVAYLLAGEDPHNIPHQTKRPFPKEDDPFTAWMFNKVSLIAEYPEVREISFYPTKLEEFKLKLLENL